MGGSCTVAHDDHQNSQPSRQRQRLAYVVLAEAQVDGDEDVTVVTSGALTVTYIALSEPEVLDVIICIPQRVKHPGCRLSAVDVMCRQPYNVV